MARRAATSRWRIKAPGVAGSRAGGVRTGDGRSVRLVDARRLGPASLTISHDELDQASGRPSARPRRARGSCCVGAARRCHGEKECGPRGRTSSFVIMLGPDIEDARMRRLAVPPLDLGGKAELVLLVDGLQPPRCHDRARHPGGLAHPAAPCPRTALCRTRLRRTAAPAACGRGLLTRGSEVFAVGSCT